ncbi:hypothetical protein BHG04_29135, partial [Klebsiella pneumoniae]
HLLRAARRQPTFLMPGCTQPFGELSHEITDSDINRGGNQAQLTALPTAHLLRAARRQPTFLMPGCTQPFGELSHEITDSD